MLEVTRGWCSSKVEVGVVARFQIKALLMLACLLLVSLFCVHATSLPYCLTVFFDANAHPSPPPKHASCSRRITSRVDIIGLFVVRFERMLFYRIANF